MSSTKTLHDGEIQSDRVPDASIVSDYTLQDAEIFPEDGELAFNNDFMTFMEI